MDKNYADKIISEYIEKIFGFALSKMMNTDKAEELASRITFDVYTSILKSDNINNINGYIYRVASNVYARFIDEEVRGRHISLDEVRIPCEHDFTVDFENDETYIYLRKKISYLGRIQREIVVMHYFQRLKQNEIAKRLNIPLGTVKWHLHDARNQIKEGMNRMDRMNEKINLGIKPIKFTRMGISGCAAPDGKDTKYYLSKLISQNIAYAAYWESKSITEIAEELGVPAAFVEDEVSYLEDYGFMDKIAGGKYLTNIYITTPNKEIIEKKHELYKKYAKIVREKYVPLIIDFIKDYKTKKIYVPEDSLNFLAWTFVTYACKHKLYLNNNADWYNSKYRVKRKDGGDYVATAEIENHVKVDYDKDLYTARNNMTNGSKNTYSWQLKSYYDSRSDDYADNKNEDYEYLYEFITGKLVKIPENADKFKRLFDKGYLIQKGDTEYINMIVAESSIYNMNDFINTLPSPPNDLKTASEELDAEMLKLNKSQYPAHMQELCRMWNTNCLADQNFTTYVLELLVADGTLKPLTDTQKHSVNTIMFCDTLPE